MDLDSLLDAKSIAIIGVSSDLNKIGGQPLKFLLKHKYKGKIYPVNPRYEEVAGFKCYPKVQDIEKPVDLAIVLVSAARSVDLVKGCIEANVRNCVLCAGGFSEQGPEGMELEGQVKGIVKKSKMRMVGPNCLGVLNVHASVITGFNPALDADVLPKGNISVVSQSAGLAYSFLSRGIDAGLGFRYVVTTGNEVDLTVSDFLDYSVSDDQTDIIMMCLEGIRDEEKFVKALQKAKDSRKPILVIKAGKTDAGKKAALSHTGALAGSSMAYDTLFKKYNLIPVDDIEQAIDVIRILKKYKKLGPSAVIITASGGTGAIAADAIATFNMNLADLSEKTLSNLDTILPPYASRKNPVDVTAQIFNDENLFANTIDCLSAAEEVDTLALVIGPTAGKYAARLASSVVSIQKKSKPILVSWSSWAHEGHSILRKADIPLFYSPVYMAQCMEKVVKYCHERDMQSEMAACMGKAGNREKNIEFISKLTTDKITEYDTKLLLKEWGIGISKEFIVKDAAAAKDAAASIGYPVVVKIVSPDIWHKTEAGLVALNLSTGEEVFKAGERILRSARKAYPDADIKGVLVQEMVKEGVEVIIGVDNKQQFGPVLMFGAGGIHVELYKDVSFRILPLSKRDVVNMINETKVVKLLRGFRGSDECDIDALIDAMMKLSNEFFSVKDRISTLDINPLKVLKNGRGVKAVDAMCSFMA